MGTEGERIMGYVWLGSVLWLCMGGKDVLAIMLTVGIFLHYISKDIYNLVDEIFQTNVLDRMKWVWVE